MKNLKSVKAYRIQNHESHGLLIKDEMSIRAVYLYLICHTVTGLRGSEKTFQWKKILSFQV